MGGVLLSLERFLVAAACILLLVFVLYALCSEWREYQDLASKVRQALPAERCRRCGGEFTPWRGSWSRVNASIEYVKPRQGEPFLFFKHEFALKCRGCQKWTVFWVRSDGKVVDRNRSLGLEPDP